MDEDRLSPRLGRLIDQAKAAARVGGSVTEEAEGVALLGGDGEVYVGHTGAEPASPRSSAADVALARARRGGCSEILAASVAAAADTADTVPPSAESRRALAGIDLELPLVFKQRGRWVSLPLSHVSPRE